MNNVVELNVKFRTPCPTRRAMVKDYLSDYSAAVELLKKLLLYHHSRGNMWVKAWIEPTVNENNRKTYAIRSNIVFKVPEGTN